MFQTSNQYEGIAIAVSDLGSGKSNSYTWYILCISLGPQSYIGNMVY